jgi:hypothetical protein
MSYTVQCTTCDARGPHVIIQGQDMRLNDKDRKKFINEAQTEAIDRWNKLGDK